MDEKEKIFGISFNIISLIITSILIPSIAFLCVNFYTRLKEKLRLRYKLNTIKQYALFWIAFLIKRLHKNINNIEEFKLKNLALNRFDYINFNSVNLHTDKLKAISSLELFSSFYENVTGDIEVIKKYYYDLLNSIDFFETKSEEIKHRILENGKKVVEHMKIMRETITAINEFRVKYIQADFENLKKDEFLFTFYTIHQVESKNFSIGLLESRDKYIKPLHDHCSKSIQKNPMDIRIPEIQKQTHLFLETYDWFKKEKERISKYLDSSVESLKSTIDNLESFRIYHKSSKFKRLFKLT